MLVVIWLKNFLKSSASIYRDEDVEHERVEITFVFVVGKEGVEEG